MQASVAAMTMSSLCTSSTAITINPAFNGLRAAPSVQQVKPHALVHGRRRSSVQPVKALMNPADNPILKEALKEPIAFLGGVFAGLLRLDLNEEPLKDWVAKTAKAAGVDLTDPENIDSDDSIPEDIQID